MTPITGFVIAVVAGWIVHNGRRAAAVVIIPWLAVLTVQTWILAAGRGHNPPSTVSQLPGAIGYWAVQGVFLALAIGIAAELGALRAGAPQKRASDSTRSQTLIASGLLAVATAIFVLLSVVTSVPVRHHSAGGKPPIPGLIGMALCVVTFAALGVATIRRRRSTARQELAEAGPMVTGTARR